MLNPLEYYSSVIHQLVVRLIWLIHPQTHPKLNNAHTQSFYKTHLHKYVIFCCSCQWCDGQIPFWNASWNHSWAVEEKSHWQVGGDLWQPYLGLLNAILLFFLHSAVPLAIRLRMFPRTHLTSLSTSDSECGLPLSFRKLCLVVFDMHLLDSVELYFVHSSLYASKVNSKTTQILYKVLFIGLGWVLFGESEHWSPMNVSQKPLWTAMFAIVP